MRPWIEAMRKVIVSNQVSLDGFIKRKVNEIDRLVVMENDFNVAQVRHVRRIHLYSNA